ncbi:hypothetical protein, partial [Klebsiella aerogenes]|uniref:hypothetical protein n=1 Tax=Klebsiella aerogenes TaxID=548 RepID=UPI0019545DE9
MPAQLSGSGRAGTRALWPGARRMTRRVRRRTKIERRIRFAAGQPKLLLAAPPVEQAGDDRRRADSDRGTHADLL